MLKSLLVYLLPVIALTSQRSLAQQQSRDGEYLRKLRYLIGRKIEADAARATRYSPDGLTVHVAEPSIAEADFRSADRVQSLASADDAWCQYLWNQGTGYDGEGSFQKARDTLRLFIETCFDQHDGNWIGRFEQLGGAESGVASHDDAEWMGYREWLKKVLYYNTDTDYYCADVDQIVLSYSLGTYYNQSAKSSVLSYVLNEHKCPRLEADFKDWLATRLYWRHQLWVDSMTRNGIDTIANPYDTTLPSIEDLGLGLLRGKPNEVSGSSAIAGPSLLGATALNNPFSESLEISIRMGRQALVTAEMFDLLGNTVPLSGMKYMLKESGPQRITVPVGPLPAGTYYLRVSTDWGDVKTIKVVKR